MRNGSCSSTPAWKGSVLKMPDNPGIPMIRRARGFYLYDHRGRRYLDLWQAGGRAILGHRPGRLVGELKGVMEKGLLFPMPGIYLPRLIRELRRRYPSFGSFWIADQSTVRAGIARYMNCGSRDVEIADPALGQDGPVVLDRPLLAPEARKETISGADVVLPVVPFALTHLQPVCFRRQESGVEQDQALSGVLLAGILRSLHDLDRLETPDWYDPRLLQGCAAWHQRGFYITPAFDHRAYPGVFARFLDAGVLLAPTPGEPSVLPGVASHGEMTRLLGLFKEGVVAHDVG